MKKNDKEQELSEREKLKRKVLANGRKFRYPLQFSKHRVMIITIILSTVAVLAGIAVLLLSLYHWNQTGDTVYRITKFVSLPVAQVEEAKVRYSDFLLIYRSSWRPVEQQIGKLKDAKDLEEVRQHYKKIALQSAEEYSFALQLAKQEGINITKEDVLEAVAKRRKVGGAERSEAGFLNIIRENFGLDREEYEHLTYLQLTKTAVMQKLDKKAEGIANLVEAELLKNPANWLEVLKKYGEQVQYEESELVDFDNLDGGRAAQAALQEIGQVSKAFLSDQRDGFYIVKTINKNEKKVSYQSIKIPFKEFSRRFKAIQKEGKIKEYIKM